MLERDDPNEVSAEGGEEGMVALERTQEAVVEVESHLLCSET